MHVCASLLGFSFVIATATSAFAQSYSVAGLGLGEKVHFGSKTYRQYECSPSEQFENFTWCQTRREEREKGVVLSKRHIRFYIQVTGPLFTSTDSKNLLIGTVTKSTTTSLGIPEK
jgi:hypothetical protein